MSEDGQEQAVEFLAKSEYYEDAAKPYPAHKNLPEWYKKLDFMVNTAEKAPDHVNIPDDKGREMPTARACMSFLDAMTMGWIIPFPFDVKVRTFADGKGMDIQADVDFNVAEPHNVPQLGREEHPAMPGPIVKFVTPWIAKTPENVSALITHPFNRGERRFRGFSGVVETDSYFTNLNMPSLWLEEPYQGTIEAGTPMLQFIPFDRRNIVTDGVIRSLDPMEERKHEKYGEMVSNEVGVYRENVWEPKDQARVVEKE